MSQPFRNGTIAEGSFDWSGLSEREAHTEHRDALDATIFRAEGATSSELVLELEAGELRVRRPA